MDKDQLEAFQIDPPWNRWLRGMIRTGTKIHHVQIEFPGRAPTTNTLLRMHYRARKRLEDGFYYLIKSAGVNLEIPPARKGESRALMVTCWTRNAPDRDNLWGGAKPIIDAAKKAGLIYDDDDRHASLLVERHASPYLKIPKIVIDLIYQEPQAELDLEPSKNKRPRGRRKSAEEE